MDYIVDLPCILLLEAWICSSQDTVIQYFIYRCPLSLACFEYYQNDIWICDFAVCFEWIRTGLNRRLPGSNLKKVVVLLLWSLRERKAGRFLLLCVSDKPRHSDMSHRWHFPVVTMMIVICCYGFTGPVRIDSAAPYTWGVGHGCGIVVRESSLYSLSLIFDMLGVGVILLTGE